MNQFNRRDFLADVGKGMLIASVGSTLAADLGLATATADDSPTRLRFGDLDPLVTQMQETAPDRLLPALAERMQQGTTLKQLVSAGALANARAFGGQDYIGYHTLMALLPAYEMSKELPAERQALPVFKVLYRNSQNLQNTGANARDALHALETVDVSADAGGGERLQQAVRKVDMSVAERTCAALAAKDVQQAFNDLQYIVQDEINVHRVVLALRSYSLLDLTGREHAATMLRQSVRFCIDEEQNRQRRKLGESAIRSVLPKALDRYGLIGKPLGTRQPDDAWLAEMSQTIALGSRESAADAVANALAEGMAPESVGEAISLAANLLVLRDPGRANNDQPGKPKGSVHGDSVGVHASDAANAWRNIARASNQRNVVASLIVGAFHTAGQAGRINAHSYPLAEQLKQVRDVEAASLLKEADAAIRAQDQFRACALVTRYGQLDLPARPVFDLLLKYAVSEDGALHAEKYYRTVTEEFTVSRPAFRTRHLAALARVTASEYGRPAPGYADACKLLKVTG